MKEKLQFLFVVQKMEDSMLLCAMLLKDGYDKSKMKSVYCWPEEPIEQLQGNDDPCLLFIDKAFVQSVPEYVNSIKKQALIMPIILVEDGLDSQTNTSDIIELGVQEVISLRELTSNYLAKAVHHAVERHHMRQQIRETAIFDILTGLYNRRGFMERANQSIAMAKRLKMNVVVLFMDIDHMKWVNDTLGHQEGDALLIETAALLRLVFRKNDVIGRIGGDEFAVLMIREHGGAAERAIYRITEWLRKYNDKRNGEYPLSLSIGKAEGSNACDLDLNKMLAQADEKMYAAKRTKRGKAPI